MALMVGTTPTWSRRARRLGLVLAACVCLASPVSSAFVQTDELAVRFSPTAGTFVGSETVTLSVETRADIHYTLDGTLPTSMSPVYREPITLETSTRLRAVALKPGASARGPVATEIYLRVSPEAQTFTSHLPVILIHTFESGWLDARATDHVQASLLVIDPTAGAKGLVGRAVLDARIGIHVRGQTSRAFPKKQYAVELRGDGDDDDREQPLLGLPSHSDWVLSDPLVYDRSFIRNAVAFAISNRIGRYAPRTRFTEVFMVDDAGDLRTENFLGLYTLIEKIDRDADRVNVNRLPANATEPPDLTGGFILAIDKGGADFTAAGRWIQFVYPDAAQMARPERQPQLDYIRSFIDSFGQAVAAPDFKHPSTGQHYSAFIDVEAFIDHHIINILTKNVDGMRFSSYFYKERGGRLVAGPVWDFDRSLGTPYDTRATEPEEWMTRFARGGATFAEGWWGLLFRDPDFQARYKARFKKLLDDELSVASLDRLVDAQVADVGAAGDRNFRLWFRDPPEHAHAAEIAQLKDFLRRRVAWIATQLESNF